MNLIKNFYTEISKRKFKKILSIILIISIMINPFSYAFANITSTQSEIEEIDNYVEEVEEDIISSSSDASENDESDTDEIDIEEVEEDIISSSSDASENDESENDEIDIEEVEEDIISSSSDASENDESENDESYTEETEEYIISSPSDASENEILENDNTDNENFSSIIVTTYSELTTNNSNSIESKLRTSNNSTATYSELIIATISQSENNLIIQNNKLLTTIGPNNSSLENTISDCNYTINDEKGYIEGEVLIIKSNNNTSNTNSQNGLLKASQNDEFSDLLNEAITVYTFNDDETTNNENNKNANNQFLLGASQDDNDSQNDDNSTSLLYLQTDKYTTEELIENLSTLPNVELVEPNHIYHLDSSNTHTYEIDQTQIEKTKVDETNTEKTNYTKYNSSTNTTNSYTKLLSDTSSNSTDYTSKQWYLPEHNATTDSNYSIEVPNWNVTTATNSEGVIVAVIDVGVDINHPDLKNVIWDEGDIYQTSCGGGKYGYNAVVGTPICDGNFTKDDPTNERVSHGTHVSGIIAAEWNDYGVSGICNGAKILPVRIFNDHRATSDYNGFLAYKYLIELKQQGVNIVCANNSWGGQIESKILYKMVKEAGKYGIASCFASGNSSKDNDLILLSPSSFKNLDCALTVNSSDMEGVLSDFSNYGAATTDVASPGSYILSCSTTLQKGYDYNITGNAPLYTSRFVKGHESEDFFNINSIELGNNVEKTSVGAFGVHDGELYFINFHISTNSEAKIKLVSNGFTTDDLAEDKLFATYTIGVLSQYANAITYRTEIYAKECNADGSEKSDGNYDYITIATASSYLRPSEEHEVIIDLKGVYLIQNDDSTYSYYKPVLGDTTESNKFHINIYMTGFDNSTNEEVDNYYMYLDKMDIHNTEAVPYQYDDGTSMASPVAAGAIAVIAKKYNTATPSEWVARLKASTFKGASSLPSGNSGTLITDDSCISGGIIDLKNALNEITKPVVNSIDLVSTASNLWEYNISGFFFGDSKASINIGNVSFNSNIISWTDKLIKIRTTNEIYGGRLEVKITRTDSAYGRNYFSIDENVGDHTFSKLSLDNWTSSAEKEDFDSSLPTNIIIVDNKLYLFGLYSHNIYKIFCYDISLNLWTEKISFIHSSFTYTDDCYSLYSNPVERNGYIHMLATRTSFSNNTSYLEYGIFSYDISNNNISFNELTYEDSTNENLQYSTLFVGNDSNKTLYGFGGHAYDNDMSYWFVSNSIYKIDLDNLYVKALDTTLPLYVFSSNITKIDQDYNGDYCIYLYGGYKDINSSNYNNSITKIIINPNKTIKTSLYDNSCSDISKVSFNYDPLFLPVKNGFYLVGAFMNGYDTVKFDAPNSELSSYGSFLFDYATNMVGDVYNGVAYVLADSSYTDGQRVFKYFDVEDIDPEEKPYVPSSSESSNGGGEGYSGSIGLEFQNATDIPTNNILNIVAFDKTVTLEFDPLTNKFMFAKYDKLGNKSYITNKWVCKVNEKGKKEIYLTDENGFMMTGFVQKENKLYYLSTDINNYGQMLTGNVTINDQVLFFDTDGHFADSPSKAPTIYQIQQ